MLAKDALDELVAKLHHVARTAALNGALEIGALVTHAIFAGDAAALRSQGRKNASLRKLARHPNLPFSAVTLWRSVWIYELSARFPALAKSKHLGIAHLRTLLGLPQEVQERLYRLAETERWTVEHLERVVAGRRAKSGRRRGRKPLPATLKSLRRIERLAEGDGLPDDFDVLEQLEENEARRAREAVRGLRAWCDGAAESLDRRLNVIEAPKG